MQLYSLSFSLQNLHLSNFHHLTTKKFDFLGVAAGETKSADKKLRKKL
jgi:hypothetical protein